MRAVIITVLFNLFFINSISTNINHLVDFETLSLSASKQKQPVQLAAVFFYEHISEQDSMQVSQSLKKEKKTFESIKKKAEKGDAEAQYKLGNIYYYGQMGKGQNTRKAEYWYGKADKQNHIKAQQMLPLLHCHNGFTQRVYL